MGGASYIDFEGSHNYLLNLEGGVGFHWPLTPVLDLVGTGSLVYQKIDSRFPDDSVCFWSCPPAPSVAAPRRAADSRPAEEPGEALIPNPAAELRRRA